MDKFTEAADRAAIDQIIMESTRDELEAYADEILPGWRGEWISALAVIEYHVHASNDSDSVEGRILPDVDIIG